MITFRVIDASGRCIDHGPATYVLRYRDWPVSFHYVMSNNTLGPAWPLADVLAEAEADAG